MPLARRLPLPVAVLGLVLAAGCRPPQPPPVYTPQPVVRARVPLAGPWRFLASDSLTGAEAPTFDDRRWTEVAVPHTWAIDDPRPHSHAWYRLRFRLPWSDAGQRLFVEFEGAATVAEVYVNGRHLGQHRGAYTRFIFDITDAVLPASDNVLAVRLDNTARGTADCLPSGMDKQLYRVYGGLYRRVWLLRTPATYIDPTDLASSGVTFLPGAVSRNEARYSLKVLARNERAQPRAVETRTILCDPQGHVVAEQRLLRTIAAHARETFGFEDRLAAPRLWGPGHPELYDLHVELSSEGRLADRVSHKVGFRSLRLAGEGRFELNGEPILIRGIGKHQETETALSAVSDADLEEDFRNLADLGVNMVRLAHYPHAPLAYDLADRYGLLVWAENGNSNSAEAGPTGELITREMVRQNINHPSIVVWSIGNETGFRGVARYSTVVRAEDPSRLVTYASNTGARRPKARRQVDFIAENVYPGWYYGFPWDLDEIGPRVHYVSETGGGAVVTQHCNYGRERFVIDRFEPAEYRQFLYEAQFQTVFRNHLQEVGMYLPWLLRDFAMPGPRKYKGVNTKGLLTRDSFRKDEFYLYRSFLRPETPTVFIASKTYFLRHGSPSDAIKAYSNSGALTLVVNDGAPSRLANGEHRHRRGQKAENVFAWREVFRPGKNVVRVRDDAGHDDTAIFHFLPGDASAWPEDPAAAIVSLRSSNPTSPARFIDAPVTDQWPFYFEADGTADNTFTTIPEAVRGARWIATRRLSKPEAATRLEFRVRPAGPGADVWILFSASARPPAGWSRAGFADTQTSGEWRDNALKRVPFRLWHRDCRASETVRIEAATLDYVVLIRERGAPR